MSPARILVAGTATAAGLALLAYASAAPLAYHPGDAARLRLSWSARPERIEVCRQLSAEEQAEREEHMRQRVECEGTSASYALLVEVDGRTVEKSVVRGAGLRNDRPLYLLKDYAVPPGAHRVRVALTRREAADTGAPVLPDSVAAEADTGIFAGRAQREVTERSRRARAAIPASLVLDTAVTFGARQVTLVTFSAERRVLELRAASGRR